MFKLALLSLLAVAYAAVTPTSPDGSTVVKVGSPINALWDKDTAAGSKWTNMQIQLMTGDNLNMVALQTVATGIDGTTATSYSFNAPNVSPYSKIYFLQFTAGGDVSTAQWTTRFTIAGPDGQTTTPPNSTVYNGNTVQWGTGMLVGGSSSSSSNSTTGATGSASSSAASAAGSVSTISVPASSTTAIAAISASASSVSSKVSGAASTVASASAAATTSKSAAGRVQAGGVGALVLGAAGALLL